MLTQEDYMVVVALRAQGFTIAEIAEDLGYHPATILEAAGARLEAVRFTAAGRAWTLTAG
jgi:hypothetical protein